MLWFNLLGKCCWEVKLSRSGVPVPCSCSLHLLRSVEADQCISGAFLTSFTRGPLCQPHALFFTSRRPSGLNLDMSHEQGYSGLLYCRRRSVPSQPRDTGGNLRRSHYSTWSVCLFTISRPPLLLISPPASLPASSFTLTHFFLLKHLCILPFSTSASAMQLW